MARRAHSAVSPVSRHSPSAAQTRLCPCFAGKCPSRRGCKSAYTTGAFACMKCKYIYLVLAYCFGAFTAIMVAGVFWLGCWHRREEARSEQERRDAFSQR